MVIVTLSRLRLASGLVLFAFVLGHLANHTLGLISLAAMDRATALTISPWRTLPGTVLLAGAAAVHIGVALLSLYHRRTLRLRRWEVLQIALGLPIPVLLAQHIAGTRIAHEALGLTPDYPFVLFQLWIASPGNALLQALALVVVWTHACIGLHFWLRLEPWYRRAAPFLYAAALLLPALALAGFLASGMDVRALAARAGWTEEILAEARYTPAVGGFARQASAIASIGFLALVAAVFAARGLRSLARARSGIPRLYYRDSATLKILPGSTVLETIRAAGIAHASICGGRGRCSTCRVRVGEGADALPPPAAQERKVLDRIGAPPNVRLACQVRPTRDLEVTPLLPPTATARDAFAGAAYLQGEERVIAILFADLRDFTRLAHGKLPFDVVFVLNRYFAAMGRAIEEAGGRLDKFIGDGVMALFGVEAGPEEGCRRALDAARRMAGALDELNAALAGELPEPLSMGIGIHVGPAIVGAMGYGPARALTAIGDAVNTASRLEALTKEYDVQLVASEDVMRRAGVDASAFELRKVDLRGRAQILSVRLSRPLSTCPRPARHRAKQAFRFQRLRRRYRAIVRSDPRVAAMAGTELYEAAIAAMRQAHVPYSNFPVGAAILTDTGKIFAGCNIENASYPEGWCAETSAIAHMVMAGERRIAEVAVIAELMPKVTPCGGCRQRLREFGSAATKVHLCDVGGVVETITLGELLPKAFELQ